MCLGAITIVTRVRFSMPEGESMFPLPKSTCKLDLACLTCPLRLHLRWIRAEGCFSFLVSFPFSFAGNLLDFSSTPLLCLTSLWVKFPLSLLHLMQWTTALSLLVCRSSYYKRWGTTSIRSSMSPFLATITCFIVLILCLIASRFVFWHLLLWCCILFAVNIVIQTHVAIIAPSLFIYSYFSSSLLFGEQYIGRRRRTPKLYV